MGVTSTSSDRFPTFHRFQQWIDTPRASSIGALLLLTAAWSAIGTAVALYDGAYTEPSVALVTIGVVLIAATLVLRMRVNPGKVSGSDLGFALGASVFIALALPAGIYGSGPDLYASHILTVAAALLVGVWAVFEFRGEVPVAYLVVVLMGVAGLTMILSSPAPAIDDWYMLQAAAAGLSHGQNFYAIHWTAHIPGEFSNGFAYLPGSALLLWPFHAAFGDVRYGLLAALVATGLVLLRVGQRSGLALTASLYLLYPKTMFGLEQSWPDALTLCALALMAWAVIRGHKAWAVVAFAVALYSKQYNWLLIPLAALWKDFGWRRTAAAVCAAGIATLPWVVADPHAFYYGAIKYNFDLPARLDSLSLNTTALIHGFSLGYGVLTVGVLATIVLAVWRMPQSAFGFFVGSAAVISVYDLLNKQSFYDEWQLAAGLVFLAIAFSRAQHDRAMTPSSLVGAHVASGAGGT